MPVTRSSVLTLALLLILPALSCLAGEDQETLTRRLVWEAATRSLDPSMPSPVSQFTDLLNKRGIKLESSKPILIEYAQGRNLPREYGNEVADFSMQVLVDWRCQEILPVLIQRATTNVDPKNEMARNGRNGALSMVMRIGGREALEIADGILKDSGKYGTLERFYVYENLAKHLMTTNPPKADKSFQAEVAKLLDSKIQEETDPASVEVMDKALATQSEEYRKSERRENLLKKHENTDLPYQKKYIRETLAQLKAEKVTLNTK